VTQQKKLQTLIENPIGEIQSNFNEIKNEMKNILKNIEEQNLVISDEIMTMKDMVGRTYLLIADVKYQVHFHRNTRILKPGSLRMVSKKSTQLTMYSSQNLVLLNLKILNSAPSGFRPLPSNTLPQSA
jgi:hypothetical protein